MYDTEVPLHVLLSSIPGSGRGSLPVLLRHRSDPAQVHGAATYLFRGLTDDEEGLVRTRDLIRELKTVKRVEVLPYHTLGLFKWQKLGIPYTLDGVRTPTAEEVKKAEEILEVSKYQ